MYANGSGRRNVSRHPSVDFSPAWSFDGARIAFSTYRHGQNDIYVMSSDGMRPIRLTNHHMEDLGPAWSP
jgi:TolB protein